MYIFLDTADCAWIRKWIDTGIIDGITTNPSHLAKEGGDPKKVVQEICALLPSKDVSIEVTETEPEKVYRQAREIAALADNVVVKIPCAIEYYAIIKRLIKEGIKINITLVFTVIQGMFMAKLGVHYISPFIGRWDDIDADGAALLYELRAMIDQYEFFDTKILAASIRSVRHLHQAIEAGADVATIPCSIFEKATQHILTDQGIALFEADWKKLGISKFP